MNEISFKCPSCGIHGKTASDHAGKTVQCKKCRTLFRLPKSKITESSGSATNPKPSSAGRDSDSDGVRPPKPAQRQSVSAITPRPKGSPKTPIEGLRRVSMAQHEAS